MQNVGNNYYLEGEFSTHFIDRMTCQFNFYYISNQFRKAAAFYNVKKQRENYPYL